MEYVYLYITVVLALVTASIITALISATIAWRSQKKSRGALDDMLLQWEKQYAEKPEASEGTQV